MKLHFEIHTTHLSKNQYITIIFHFEIIVEVLKSPIWLTKQNG